jgi:peptidoglycan/LPS O-acetylase OafA/YrhL
LNKNPTILGQMEKGNGFTAGFDYLRIGLAIAVLVWHSFILSTGSGALYRTAWSGPFRFLLAIILPMFFALSGFLVAGSLERTRVHQFVVLRALRLIPALAVEVTLSGLLLGAFFTTLPLGRYLTSPELISYFGNIVGLVRFTLPGVFEHNPAGAVVNSQLWTIPFELECYAVLLFVAAVLRDRRAFVALVVLLSLVATALAFFLDPVSPFQPIPGRALVVSFLAGVCLHLYRDKIPCSPAVGMLAALAAAVLLQIPNTCYLAAFPVAYLTVWVGSCARRKFLSATCLTASTSSTFQSSNRSCRSFPASDAGGSSLSWHCRQLCCAPGCRGTWLSIPSWPERKIFWRRSIAPMRPSVVRLVPLWRPARGRDDHAAGHALSRGSERLRKQNADDKPPRTERRVGERDLAAMGKNDVASDR